MGVSGFCLRDEVVVECGGEGYGEEVGRDVFEGEVAAEEDLPREGLAEGVDGGYGDEAGKFEDGGYGHGECCDSNWAEFGEEGGEEPVECSRPEEGAEVFVEEPREVEREIADCQADGDGDEEKGEGFERALHEVWEANIQRRMEPFAFAANALSKVARRRPPAIANAVR